MLFLGADEEAGFVGLRGARSDDIHGGLHAHGIQIGAHFAHVVVARHAVFHQPCAAKVMLHHGHITCIGLRLELSFVFLDVAEFGFLVFLLGGEHHRAREGAVEG